jgi:hypothetical protein
MPGSKRNTTDLKMPLKSNQTHDKRYTHPQFVRATDGKRDLRTTPSHARK